MTIEEVSLLMFYSTDLGTDISIRLFLKELLAVLWYEKENFSGKRPFGNSGWDYEIMKCLVSHGVIDGGFDNEGDIQDYDEKTGNALIMEIIRSL